MHGRSSFHGANLRRLGVHDPTGGDHEGHQKYEKEPAHIAIILPMVEIAVNGDSALRPKAVLR